VDNQNEGLLQLQNHLNIKEIVQIILEDPIELAQFDLLVQGLGIPLDAIEPLRDHHRLSISSFSYLESVLQTWIQKNTEHATLEALLKILEDCGLQNTKDFLKKKLSYYFNTQSVDSKID